MLHAKNTMPINVTTADGGSGKKLTITRIDQAQPEWCWAACAVMIASFLESPAASQCRLANSYLKGSEECVDACADGSKCNYPCAEEDIAGQYAAAGIKCSDAGGALDLNDIAAEINANRPILAALTFDAGSGHVLLVTGYSNENVYVIDTRPGFGETWLDYHAFKTAHGAGSWTTSWTGIARG